MFLWAALSPVMVGFTVSVALWVLGSVGRKRGTGEKEECEADFLCWFLNLMKKFRRSYNVAYPFNFYVVDFL